MSYTSTTLRTAIKEFTDYTETSFVSNLNLFITNAEQRIFTEANLEFFTKIHTGSMTSGNAELSAAVDKPGKHARTHRESERDRH